MKKIVAAIQSWIDKNVPSEVYLKECDARRLYALYTTGIRENDAAHAQAIDLAIDRLTAQLPLSSECSCKQVAFLIYEADKKALKRLCNNYCLWIAERYDEMPWFPKIVAEINYQDFTNIMTSIR